MAPFSGIDAADSYRPSTLPQQPFIPPLRPAMPARSHPSARRVSPPTTVVAALVVLAAGVVSPALRADELVLVDGRQLEAKIDAIDEAGRIRGEGLAADLTLEEVRTIRRQGSGVGRPAADLALVYLASGGRIRAQKLALADERFRLEWSGGDALQFPIDAIRAVRFQKPLADDPLAAALRGKGADVDRVLLRVDDRVEAIQALVEKIDEAEVLVQWQDRRRKFARDRLYGVVFAEVGPASKDEGVCLVKMADGSVLPGSVSSLAGGRLTLSAGDSSQLVLPWEEVREIEIRSGRVTFLSDLEPVEVREEAIVTLPRPWQRDRNVSGRPLRLAGQRYEKGIGVAARSELVFFTEGKYDMLLATVGIDEETQGRGDCLFVVVGDGQELFRERLTGRDEPRPLRVEVGGVKRLALVVEPGEDLDLGDHADWCDVRLIRAAKGAAGAISGETE